MNPPDPPSPEVLRGLCSLLAVAIVGCAPVPVAATPPVDIPAGAPPAASALAPAAAGTLAVTLTIDDIPARFAPDGDLAEWSSIPPAATGHGATVWVAAGERGIALALRLPGAAPGWPRTAVRFPLPDLPPIAFANQFGPVDVIEGWCDEADEQFMPDEDARRACKVWYGEQVELRRKIAERFERVVAAPPAIDRHGVGRAGDDTAVELWLDPSQLPPLDGVELRRFEVDVSLPSSPVPVFLVDATPREPIPFVPEGTLAHAILTGSTIVPGEVVAMVPPGDPDRIAWLLNEYVGYQWQPVAPSPGQIDRDLGQRRPVATFGDVTIERAQALPGFGWDAGDVLVTTRRDRIVAVLPVAGEVRGTDRRGDDLVLGIVTDGLASMLGTGMCGACPMVAVSLVHVHTDGTMGDIVPVADHGGNGQESVELTIEPDLSRFVFRYEASDYSATPPVLSHEEHAFRFDPKKGDYVEATRSTPVR